MKFKTKKYSVEYCLKNNIAIRCRNTLDWVTVGQIFERNNIPFGQSDGSIKINERNIENSDDICLSTAERPNRTLGFARSDFFIKAGCEIIESHRFIKSNMQQLDNKSRRIHIKCHTG